MVSICFIGCYGVVSDSVVVGADAAVDSGAEGGLSPTDSGDQDASWADGGVDASVSDDDGGRFDAGLSDGGGRDAGCPAAPPFDLDAAGMNACTTSVMIAVGYRARRIVTFDGTTWLDDQLDDGNCFDGTCYDDAAFQAAFGLGYIVTASDFGIFTSADRGHSWVKAPAPAPQKWGEGVHVANVVWTGSRFVVFSDTASFTSNDGLTWQKHSIALSGSHVAFGAVAVVGGGRIVASAGTTSLNLSDDGVSWRTIDINASFKSMAYGAGVIVGVGNGVRGSSTNNGETWAIVRDDCAANDPSRCIGSASQVLFRQGVFVFTGGNSVLESVDGVHFTKTGSGTGLNWSHAWFMGRDFGVGYPGTSYRVSSVAGGPWESHSWPGASTEGLISFTVGQVLSR